MIGQRADDFGFVVGTVRHRIAGERGRCQRDVFLRAGGSRGQDRIRTLERGQRQGSSLDGGCGGVDSGLSGRDNGFARRGFSEQVSNGCSSRWVTSDLGRSSGADRSAGQRGLRGGRVEGQRIGGRIIGGQVGDIGVIGGVERGLRFLQREQVGRGITDAESHLRVINCSRQHCQLGLLIDQAADRCIFGEQRGVRGGQRAVQRGDFGLRGGKVGSCGGESGLGPGNRSLRISDLSGEIGIGPVESARQNGRGDLRRGGESQRATCNPGDQGNPRTFQQHLVFSV